MEELDCVKELKKNISSKIEVIPRSDYLKELNKRKEIEREALYLQNLEKEKEYNEKISNTIFGTGLKPSVVGSLNSDNPHMNYDFVSFDKVVKKDAVEYINENKIDYDVKFDKKTLPSSFLLIKEGEIQKGKEWYLNYDPKLPDEIAEMMARFNWGDLKYMTKKSAREIEKNYHKKGKDLAGEYGLTTRHTDKNNPIVVNLIKILYIIIRINDGS
jgi:hypothetical protein